MIPLVSGTNRPGSNTLKVTAGIASLYAELGVATKLIDFSPFSLWRAAGGDPYAAKRVIKAARTTALSTLDILFALAWSAIWLSTSGVRT